MTFKEFIDELKFRYNGQTVKIEDYDCEKIVVNDDFKKNFEELRDECNLELTNEELTDKKGIVHNVDDVTVSYMIMTMNKKLVLFIYVCNKDEKNVIGEYESCVYQEDVVYRPDTWEDFASLVSNIYKYGFYDINHYRYIGRPTNSIKSEKYHYKVVKSNDGYDLDFEVYNENGETEYSTVINIPQASRKALFKMRAVETWKKFVIALGVAVVFSLIAGFIIMLNK